MIAYDTNEDMIYEILVKGNKYQHLYINNGENITTLTDNDAHLLILGIDRAIFAGDLVILED